MSGDRDTRNPVLQPTMVAQEAKRQKERNTMKIASSAANAEIDI